MKQGALTEETVRDAGQGRYADGDGLDLVVSERGAASWVATYTFDGRERQIPGRRARGKPCASIEEAREWAQAIRREAARGIDPMGSRIVSESGGGFVYTDAIAAPEPRAGASSIAATPVDESEVHELGKLLAAGEPPSWLLEAISVAVVSVRFAIASERRVPARKASRDDVERLLQALSTIRDMMDGPNVTLMLPVFEALGAGWHDVSVAIEVADGILAGIRSGPGNDKHDDGTPPKVACAVWVAELWSAVRGRRAGHTSVAAQRACDRLWRLAGGNPSRWGAEYKPVGWREHLKVAKAGLAAGYYGQVRRLLEPALQTAKNPTL